jgi:hypothetical protein
MKRVMYWLSVCGLAAVLVGCQPAADAPTDEPATEEPAAESAAPTEDAQSSVGDDTSSEFTLVSLKVPNMT